MSAVPRSEFRLGWKALLAAMLGVACGGSPLPFNVIGFFIGPLREEFGWSVGQISLGITVMGVTGALLAPVYGALADRYGVRVVALNSLVAFGLVFAAFAFLPDSLPGYYAFWFVLGLVLIGSTPVTFTRGVNLWFFRHRGLALGLTLVGTSLAAVVLGPLTVFGLEQFGWRLTFPFLALLPLAIALPVGLAFFREPRPEERPVEIVADDGTALVGRTLREACRQRQFWLIVGSILVFALGYGGIHVHLAPMVMGAGYSAGQAAGVMATLGLATLAGRLIAGVLLDRVWAPLVTFPFLSLPAIAAWLLGEGAFALSIAMAAALMLGLASGVDDLLSYMTARYFGMAHYGRIYGCVYLAFGVAAAISPAIYGFVRDATGSYDAILDVAIVLFLVGASLPLLLGRYPDLRARR